jgi:hypothetical protein
MSDNPTNLPGAEITIYSPADTGRPQKVTIVPQFRNIRNQVLTWNVETGMPEWRLLTDAEAEVIFGAPRPLLMNDMRPLLAGDGFPFLFRNRLGLV